MVSNRIVRSAGFQTASLEINDQNRMGIDRCDPVFLINPGSGSNQNDIPFSIIAMEEELDGDFMRLGTLGKREGFTHEPSQTLAEGVFQALNLASLLSPRA